MTATSGGNQKVGLGCGTLILIALIVLIFANQGSDDLSREIRQVGDDVKHLKAELTQARDFVSEQRHRTETIARKLDELENRQEQTTRAIEELTQTLRQASAR